MTKGSVYVEIQEGRAIKTVIDANGGEILNMLVALTAACATAMLKRGVPEIEVENCIHTTTGAALAEAKAEAKTWE